MSIRRILLLLFIATTFFVKVGHAQLSILPLTNATPRTIVVMGSSSAYGWKSSSPDSAWVGRLQTDLGFYGRGDVIIDIAYPGNTTYVCLPTGSAHPGYAPAPDPTMNVTKAISLNPTFVIISLPTNDINNTYSNSEISGNFATITNALNSAHIPYILTGTQPRDLSTDATCSTAFDGASVCLSTGGFSPGQQTQLVTLNTALATQYPSTSTPYATPVVDNFLDLLSVSSSNHEIKPIISYGDGIHYLDNGHFIVYNSMVNFQYYKELVCFTQTITMGPLTSSVGAADFAPGSASSGLALTYASDNAAVATIVAGKVHIVGAGTANITASQAGNQHYLVAANVTVLLTVASTGPPPVTYDWSGGTSTDWQDFHNWKVGAATATDYPGHLLSTDIVNIGVNINYTNSPIITGSIPNAIASLTFGALKAVDSLTINSGATLTITGQLLQKHTTAGVTNSGNTTIVKAITTYIKGGGIINCGSLAVGDATKPTNSGAVNITKLELGSPAQGSTITMNINGSLIINTQSSNSAGNILSTNNAQFSLTAGTLNIVGQVQLTDGGAATAPGNNFRPASTFSVDLYKTSDSPVLNLQNATAFASTISTTTFNKIDFYNVVTAGGTGIATVNYTGTTNQEVYNLVSGSTTASEIIDDNAGDAVYENLGFSGSGTKTVDAGGVTPTLIVGQTVNLAAGTETVDLSTNSCALITGSDFTTGTGSTLNCGLRAFIVYGSFSNSGACNFGAAPVTFSSAGDNDMFTVNPQLLTNVLINGDGNETITGGSFVLASTGVLTLNGTTTILHTGGFLTLNSDATGSATVANIPTGCSIVGAVNVQRFVSNHRAYRLASSPVYNGTVTVGTPSNTFNDYSLNYIKNSIYITGTTGTTGGFDKIGNPTIYLYRENLVPLYTTFLNSNFRGVNDITAEPSYKLDSETGSFNIPSGNGFMFYYRGSRKQATLAALTTVGAASTTDTLTATGTLNQGKVTFTNWFLPAKPNLLYTTISGVTAIEGTNLVGNPYASSIDWDQYSTTDNTKGIFAPNVAPFSYQLIPTGAQGSGNYGVYTAGSNGLGGTNGATNIIGSGVGFFVRATNTPAQLVFIEKAKISTQAVVGTTLFMATHVSHMPATNTSDAGYPYLRLQLTKDSINADESVIRFDPNATAVFNVMEDAQYRVGTGAVSLSSLSADKIGLAINRVPLPRNKQTLAIPLTVAASADGNYHINLKTINQVPQLYTIWLMDKFVKDSTDMRKNPVYNFAISRADTNTYGSGRFLAVIRQDAAYVYKLLSFGAGKVPGQFQVSVSWTTQYESNYTNFTIERSTDNGKIFNTIGGFTSTSAGAYNFVDKMPSFGDNQYRLKQVDIDNNTTYSAIADVRISNKDNRTVCVYPNPALNVINICIDPKSAGTSSFKIRISNSAGVLIKDVISKTANWQENVGNLFTGTYLVQVINNKDNSLVGEVKFVKL